MTCRCRASNPSRRPISTATAPPTPASTSSKTNVTEPPPSASTTSTASRTRDISPPEATLPRLRGALPGLAENSRSTWSDPVGPRSIVVSSNCSRACGIASAASSPRTRSTNTVAAAARASCSWTASSSSLLLQHGDPRGQLADPVVGLLEILESSDRPLGPGEHLVAARAVLAQQPGQLEPSLGDLLQPARLGLQAVEIAGQITGQVVQQVADLADPIGQLLGSGVGIGQPVGGLPRHGQGREGAAGLVVGAGDRLDRRVGVDAEIAAGLQPLGFRRQGHVLARLGVGSPDLLQPEPQHVDLPGPLLRLGVQPVPLGDGGAQLVVAVPVARQPCLLLRPRPTGRAGRAAGPGRPAGSARTGRARSPGHRPAPRSARPAPAPRRRRPGYARSG